MNTLHVYPQSDNHDHAYIVGTLEALLELRAAIDRAIATGAAQAAATFACDGEGYLAVVCPRSDDDMTDAMLPYSEIKATHGKMLIPSSADHRRLMAEAYPETKKEPSAP